VPEWKLKPGRPRHTCFRQVVADYRLAARIPFGHSREDWLPSINLLCHLLLIQWKYFFSLLYPSPDFILFCVVYQPFLARQLSLPYAKYWNCAHSEFFPSSLNNRRSHGVQVHPRPSRATKKNFLGIFVGMRQKWGWIRWGSWWQYMTYCIWPRTSH